MSPEAKKKVQMVLALAIAVATLRTGWILYERHSTETEQPKAAPPLKADYYVVPKRLHPYDLKSAKELTQQAVWVREGYRYTYYPYDSGHHRSDFAHEAGLLLPIERLEIKDVVTDISPGSPDQRQVVAVFEKDGKTYSVPIGSVKGGEYQIRSDDMFFIQDPRELYKHWTADVWDAIGKHEVKPGMNELQADFAIGMGMPQRSLDSAVKTVNYPNGGKPVTVVYRDDRAVEVKAGAASSQ